MHGSGFHANSRLRYWPCRRIIYCTSERDHIKSHLWEKRCLRGFVVFRFLPVEHCPLPCAVAVVPISHFCSLVRQGLVISTPLLKNLIVISSFQKCNHSWNRDTSAFSCFILANNFVYSWSANTF
jgi:hypothetical protein